MTTLKHLITIPYKNEVKIKRILLKMKNRLSQKSTYVYTQMDLVLVSFMEQPKYTKYLKITQLTNIQYDQLF